MATEQIAAAPDELDELQHDLAAGGPSAVCRRERNEKRERTQVAALAGEHAAARYRSLALRSQLITDEEFRVLCIIIDYADGNLSNSFVSPATIQKQLGGLGRTRRPGAGGRRKLRWIYALIASLTAKQFLCRHRAGWQLCLPVDVLAPGADAWHGPTDWSNRWKEVGR